MESRLKSGVMSKGHQRNRTQGQFSFRKTEKKKKRKHRKLSTLMYIKFYWLKFPNFTEPQNASITKPLKSNSDCLWNFVSFFNIIGKFVLIIIEGFHFAQIAFTYFFYVFYV